MASKGPLPGFRDFYPEDLARRTMIFRAWRAVARQYSFVEYDGPPLEPLELYTAKSGDEIVGQLYSFEDKGGRAVSLRPEMTPTFARMVAARANALPKPVRWFSIPQLFRYERAQRGRLREHFQLNVDIVGEPSALADAELLGVAIDIMRELGLGPQDVRARVSDRRLLNAVLDAIGVTDGQRGVVYGVLDKVERQPHEVSREKLEAAGLVPRQVEQVMALADVSSLADLERDFGHVEGARAAIAQFGTYLDHLHSLGLDAWVDVDLSIVRGLAYYTGTVFELFDARGELRAICGGGRYDNLLGQLGGVDLPALGFGMGDVVLGELLKARGLFDDAAGDGPDFWVVSTEQSPPSAVLRAAATLRRLGYAAEYVLNEEKLRTQKSSAQIKAAERAGAAWLMVVRDEMRAEVRPLARTPGEAARDGTEISLQDLMDPERGFAALAEAGVPAPRED
ncbi:MAG: histidine--tRNA ligase [Gemmatimonadetes bacterium]|nr:histidine--tRNA ligase [Gemmatimonadota bacterium]